MAEDGIGLVRRFEDDLQRALRRFRSPARSRALTVVTGELYGPRLSRLLAPLAAHGLDARVAAVPNDFFGRAITVAGLLTGQDIQRHLTRLPDLGEEVLVPAVCLRDTDGVFKFCISDVGQRWLIFGGSRLWCCIECFSQILCAADFAKRGS